MTKLCSVKAQLRKWSPRGCTDSNHHQIVNGRGLSPVFALPSVFVVCSHTAVFSGVTEYGEPLDSSLFSCYYSPFCFCVFVSVCCGEGFFLCFCGQTLVIVSPLLAAISGIRCPNLLSSDLLLLICCGPGER